MINYKILKDFPNYAVGDNGEVISRARKGFPVLKNITYNKDRGYCYVTLYNKGKRKNFALHRLVAETFLGRQPGLEVNHIDGNPKNNHLDNLEWVTRTENHLHAYRHGRKTNKGGAKITAEEAEQIRDLYNNHNKKQKDLAYTFGLAECTISLIINNKRWPKEKNPHYSSKK